jgi:hypothetical protein
MRVFVSYVHKNEGRVEEIVAILRHGGHEPWYDRLLAGMDWRQELGE